MIDFRVLILAIVLAFGGGWYVKGKFFDAAEVKEARIERKESAGNIVASTVKSGEIADAIAQDSNNVSDLKAQAAARVAKYQPKPEKPHDADRRNDATGTTPPAEGTPVAQNCPAGGLVLDLGTVRLLNAAAEGRTMGAASGGDAEKPTDQGAAGR